ncbi:hypothetical protein [Actinomadura kijaniata]
MVSGTAIGILPHQWGRYAFSFHTLHDMPYRPFWQLLNKHAGAHYFPLARCATFQG